MSNVLAAKVKAANKANEYANSLYPVLVNIFTNFVGQAVLKADGMLLAKVAKLLPELANTASLRVHRLSSGYSLAWVVTVCETVLNGSSCTYHDTTVYVGDLRDGVLMDLCDEPAFRTDYTVEGVLAARKAYADAMELASAAQDACYPFGISDR